MGFLSSCVFLPVQKDLCVTSPPDVWSEIAERLLPSPSTSLDESRDMLSNFSLTCKMFCFICQPYLFRNISFRHHGSWGQGKNDVEGWQRQTMVDAGHPNALASFVRNYELDGWGGDENPNLAQHLKLLPYFSGLKTLILTDITLHQSSLLTILSLGSLESLIFDRCRFVPPINEQVVLSGSLERLNHFVFKTALVDDCYCIAALLHIVATPTLHIFETNDYHCALTLLCLPDPLRIKELSITLSSRGLLQGTLTQEMGNTLLESLSDFLNRTISIVRLSIFVQCPASFRSWNPPLRIYGSSLPKLEVLECSESLMGLMHNRGIRRAHIDLHGQLCKEINVTRFESFTSESITDLAIPVSLYHMVSLKNMFPHLHSLTVLKSTGEVLCLRQESLPVAHFSLKDEEPSIVGSLERMRWNIPLQRSVLEDFKLAFPCATHICVIGGCIEWQQRDDKTWKPVVIDRLQARNELWGWHIEAVDEAGCLADLFGCVRDLKTKPWIFT